MSHLQHYINKTNDSEKKKFLKEQWDDIIRDGTIVCCCGQLRHHTLAYRCLYCGLWFCINCAEKHFGKTIAQWDKETEALRKEY